MGEKPGTFTHKVDKSQIPTCNIMGVDIAAIDMDWLLDFTFKNIKNLSGDYMCVSNVHTTVMSWEDRDTKRSITEAVWPSRTAGRSLLWAENVGTKTWSELQDLTI